MIKFDHIAVTVKDLQKSIQWYKENFNFKELRRFEKSTLEINGATLALENFTLELLEPYNPIIVHRKQEELTSCLGNTGANHLAFTVENIDEFYRKLKERQVRMITRLIDSRFFFCVDPDCVLIEVRAVQN